MVLTSGGNQKTLSFIRLSDLHEFENIYALSVDFFCLFVFTLYDLDQMFHSSFFISFTIFQF